MQLLAVVVIIVLLLLSLGYGRVGGFGPRRGGGFGGMDVVSLLLLLALALILLRVLGFSVADSL